MINFAASGDGFVSAISDNSITIYTTNLELVKHFDDRDIYDVQTFHFDQTSNWIAVVCKTGIDEEVLIWDFIAQRFILAFSAPDPVLSVRLRGERIYLCTQNEIRIFMISKNPRKIKVIPTGDNAKGLLCLTPSEIAGRQIMVFPSTSPGEVNIVNLNNMEKMTESQSLRVHNSEIAYITMTTKGELIATASVKGTIIRIVNTDTRETIHELRRGVEHADIFCINFSQSSEYICVSSSRGTVHVFSLKEAQEMVRTSWYSLFSNPRSFAIVKAPPQCKPICFFNTNDDLAVVHNDGIVHYYTFRMDGKIEYKDFLCLSPGASILGKV